MYNNEIKVYIGRYRDKDICMSDDKSKVKCYMESHRKLDKDEYDIWKTVISEVDILTKYQDIMIEEFYDWYIPNIDVMMIELFGSDISMKIKNTLMDINHITYLVCMMKSTDEADKEALIKTSNILKKLVTVPKKMKKLEKENLRSNPILYFNMDTYLQYKRSFEDQREMNSRWLYNTEKEEEI